MPILTLDTFTTEGGATLRDVPVAYDAWGALDDDGRNAIVVCHALTGSADASDWWGPLIGPGRPLDTDRFFVICLNVPGSPYGTVSPVTPNPDTGQLYGADFPVFTTRDTVALHRAALDRLGVRQVQLALGGSMGGMHVLEWAFEGDFVRALCPIAVGGRHSAWCIAWSEAQRQAIYADPHWQDGRYPPDAPPTAGLSAARMMAMVSYRSHPSFQARFGRERMAPNGTATPPFSVESYLRYQGEKLVDRFDANCYVHLTQQMDSHDVARGRGDYPDVLRRITQPTLVLGIDSDVLYPLAEQKELAEHLPDATLEIIPSPHGHDAFLIEFDTLSTHLHSWIRKTLPSTPTAQLPQ
ncbi:MAG: homoserine O-acetyltransferase [Bacteroidetes bacterium]|jgi:homoserine O-acetyltransferase|nr:homoserine O-acetyltransferase [Bacteroidota bacterium]